MNVSAHEETLLSWFKVIEILRVMHGNDDEIILVELMKIITERISPQDTTALFALTVMAIHSEPA